MFLNENFDNKYNVIYSRFCSLCRYKIFNKYGVDGDRVCEAKVKVKAAGLPKGGGQGVEEGKLAKAHQVTLGPWHHATGVMLVNIIK